MLKFLKGVVGSGGGIKDLPYNIGDPYSTAWGGWTHCRGTSKVRFVLGCRLIASLSLGFSVSIMSVFLNFVAFYARRMTTPLFPSFPTLEAMPRTLDWLLLETERNVSVL